MERCVVTGIGLITPVGIGTEPTWQALLEGRSGVGPISLFDASGHRSQIAAEVRDWDPTPFMEAKRAKTMGRFSQFAFAAGTLAMEDAELELSEEESERAGCFIGVGFGGLEQIEQAANIARDRGPRKISPYMMPAMIPNLAAGHLSMAHRLRGPSYCNMSACSSGAHAIGEAFEWIRRGRAEVMLAGGSEAIITSLGVGGFDALRALSTRNQSPERASRPWDADRDGFVMGEGAAVLVLESLTRARRRHAHIYGEIVGYGATSDAHHLTHPPKDADGAVRCMRMALSDAGLRPEQIDYVNAHGTSTPAGDQAESDALARVFGSHALDGELWVSSTKSMTGHMLGAAGAVEGAISLLSIANGCVPPTINLEVPDPECAPLDFVPHSARERRATHALSNSFGFGGTNTSLAFSRFEA
jgi:3-oxoacyl-[acyl-carrier-protein] synthase II